MQRLLHMRIFFLYLSRLSSDPIWGGLYDDLVHLLGDFLVMCSVSHFVDDVAKENVIPNVLIDEMKGLLDGCTAANPNTNVTMDRVM